MKIKREKVVEPAKIETEEIEINFPSYYKWNDGSWTRHYKLISETEVLQVVIGAGNYRQINHDKTGYEHYAIKDAIQGKEIEEEEFTEKLNEVMRNINDALISNALRLTTA